MTGREYKCAACEGIFYAEWTEEEAVAEAKDIFGVAVMDDAEQVCDDCYKKIMAFRERVNN